MGASCTSVIDAVFWIVLREVRLRDLLRTPPHAEAAVVEPEGLVAKAVDGGEVVGDEEEDPVFLEAPEEAHALLHEEDIPDGEGLVHDEHIGVHMGDHGEGQPHVHAAGISLHRLVHVLTDVGKGGDVVEALVDHPAGDPEDGGVHVDVLASGELRVEARAQLEEGRDPPAHLDRAARGGERAGDHLEEGALAGTVPPEDPEAGGRGDLEGDWVEGVEVLVVAPGLAAEPFPHPAPLRQAPRGRLEHRRLQPREGMVPDAVGLGEITDREDGIRHGAGRACGPRGGAARRSECCARGGGKLALPRGGPAAVGGGGVEIFG